MRKGIILLGGMMAVMAAMAAIVVAMSRPVLYADDMMAQGRSLYAANCQICHGANGKGDGPAAAALQPKPVDLDTPQFWAAQTDQTIAGVIQNGKGPMPAFSFQTHQLKAVIYYLRHKFKP